MRYKITPSTPKAAALAALLALTSFGCGTTPRVVAPTQQRERPEEALLPCPSNLPSLDAGVTGGDAKAAVEAVLRAKLQADAAYFECARRHAALADFINRAPTR